MILRKAVRDDIPDVMGVLADGRAAQRRAGFAQWPDGYPSEQAVADDIAAGHAFVADDCGTVAGYVAIAFSDSEYERLATIWRPAGRYAVFHRIALGATYQGRGLSKELFDMAERRAAADGATAVKIDTGTQNRAMQRILASRGYECRGIHDFVWGERLAYQKQL